MGSGTPGHRRQLHSGRVSQAGHHQAYPPRRGECRYAHGYLKAKYKKLLLHTSQHPLAKRTTVSYLSPDMACDKQPKKPLSYSNSAAQSVAC